MPKVSQVPPDAETTISTSDYLLGNQASGPLTVTFLISKLIALFWSLVNIPAGATSPITRDSYTTLPFVQSGMVWTGNAYNSTLLASMTAGIVFLNGRFISIGVVTSRAFTASKDTYIDVLDNGDGTGTLVYTTVTNNAASPALASNSMRIGIIVTGASSIAAAGSINQGQITAVLPIASSQPYTFTDSLGNIICSRDPANRTIGARIITSSVSTTGSSEAAITGLTIPVIVPNSGRNIKATLWGTYITNSVLGDSTNPAIYTGATAAALTAQVSTTGFNAQGNGSYVPASSLAFNTQPSGLIYYTAALDIGIGGTGSIAATTTSPILLLLELG